MAPEQVLASVHEVGHAAQLGLALENIRDRFSSELSKAARGREELEETLTQNLLMNSDNSRNTANNVEESNNKVVLLHKESGMFAKTTLSRFSSQSSGFVSLSGQDVYTPASNNMSPQNSHDILEQEGLESWIYGFGECFHRADEDFVSIFGVAV